MERLKEPFNVYEVCDVCDQPGDDVWFVVLNENGIDYEKVNQILWPGRPKRDEVWAVCPGCFVEAMLTRIGGEVRENARL